MRPKDRDAARAHGIFIPDDDTLKYFKDHPDEKIPCEQRFNCTPKSPLISPNINVPGRQPMEWK